MAASANPLGNNQEGSSAAQKSTSANGGVNSRNGGANTQTADTTPTASALRHNTGISLEWTPDEQSILEDLLAKLVFYLLILVNSLLL